MTVTVTEHTTLAGSNAQCDACCMLPGLQCCRLMIVDQLLIQLPHATSTTTSSSEPPPTTTGPAHAEHIQGFKLQQSLTLCSSVLTQSPTIVYHLFSAKPGPLSSLS